MTRHEPIEPAPSDENPGDRALDPGVAADTWIVIAAFNEAEVIADVAAGARALGPNVVVVDDGSADATAREARRAATHVLRHPINRGQGAALQTGIDFALQHSAGCIVTFDADGQHRPEDIPRFVHPIIDGDVDIVLGSRFLNDDAGSIPAGRRFMLRAAVAFTRIVNRRPVTDTHNGFRAFSRRAAESISISADRMSHASQLLDLIRHTGLPFREIPVDVRYSDYSMEKGQRSSNAFRIALHHMIDKVLG